MKSRDIQAEAAALKARFLAIKEEMSRPGFAKAYGVPGGDAMIYQHINGIRPISLNAATVYARGFGCRLEEISSWLAAEEEKRRSLLPSSYLQPSEDGEQSPNDQKGDENMPKLASVSRLKPHVDVATIHEYETGGAMGHGLALRDQPGVIHGWQVNREWLEKNTGHHTGIGNLCIVTGFGDSMKPMFNPGDPVLIDRGVTTMDFDGIYFFRIGDEGFIKRLQKIPTSNGFIYRAKSENPKYDTWEITQDMDFEVLGRVVKAWKGEEC